MEILPFGKNKSQELGKASMGQANASPLSYSGAHNQLLTDVPTLLALG